MCLKAQGQSIESEKKKAKMGIFILQLNLSGKVLVVKQIVKTVIEFGKVIYINANFLI